MIRIPNYPNTRHEMFQFNDGTLVVVINSLSQRRAVVYHRGSQYEMDVPVIDDMLKTAKRAYASFRLSLTHKEAVWGTAL